MSCGGGAFKFQNYLAIGQLRKEEGCEVPASLDPN